MGERLNKFLGQFDGGADSEYRVESHDWTSTAQEGDLTPDEVDEVLDQFALDYEAALASLARQAERPGVSPQAVEEFNDENIDYPTE